MLLVLFRRVSIAIVGGKFVSLVDYVLGLPIFRFQGGGIMASTARAEVTLSEAEQSLYDRLGPLFEQERLRMARALASGPLFGEKEFELRDQVHDLGAKALEVAADERQKKGGLRRR